MKGRDPDQQRASLVDEYSALAADYDRKWSFYTHATLEATLARLPVLASGTRVLDIGCGTGALLAALAEHDASLELTGLDPVAAMLEQARSRLPDRVTLLQGWADALPLAAASRDLVVSCNMFHYLTEPERALAEFARVLRPGGRLVITDWCHDFLSCRLCDAYLRLVNRAHRPAYGQAACQTLLQDAGWQVERSERYKINWLWGLMTVVATPVTEAS